MLGAGEQGEGHGECHTGRVLTFQVDEGRMRRVDEEGTAA